MIYTNDKGSETININCSLKWFFFKNFYTKITYILADLNLYSFMLPSTWTECWQSLQAGHSIQSKHLNLSSSNWQNFQSLNEMLNAVALIVGTYKLYQHKKLIKIKM